MKQKSRLGGIFVILITMKEKIFLIIGLIFIFGSIFLFLTQPVNIKRSSDTLRIDDTVLDVEIADTLEERTRGLSNRKELNERAGMLFIFETPGRYGFWMKDMNFAIDIVWINDAWHVVGVTQRVGPETFPKIFYPNEPVKYVLELPAGAVEKFTIDIGSKISFGQ